MRAIVVVPTYNEADNIHDLVGRVLAVDAGVALDMLVVDDNSPDGTGKLLDEIAATEARVRVLHREEKKGLGSAYRDGFRIALEGGYDLILEMDADLSHDPDYLPHFIEAARDADLVIGSRYVHGVCVVNWPMPRLLLSYFATVYARFVTGMPIFDATGGFKCFRREVLEAIDVGRVRSDGYAFQIEMNFKAWRAGFRLREIPIIFTDRTQGASKMSGAIVREAIVLVWKLRFGALFGRVPTRVRPPSSKQRT
ncbi:MAG: dolichyl-phosphate beta-D-mannosyltransferase [Gemmatimonadetes bacterium]|nr:dolichyl-phosphate beta-D-mannosyltransferase [Gemmatimonadota bacterium]